MKSDPGFMPALNGVCPYFTMFPLEFPYSVLKRYASEGDWVLDPFCGRGTTNYASRLLGLPSIGIDSSPVAVALSLAKLANAHPRCILASAHQILDEVSAPQDIPSGEFWKWAYHPDVLNVLCRLREGLLANCRSAARKALRAILLGALHGPTPKTRVSYFSNQAPRTYAPKPRYAVKFWRERGLDPQPVDVLQIAAERADRYFDHQPRASGQIILGDSRESSTFGRIKARGHIKWVVTSPPYYGMCTYIPDQWLRNWFIGGPAAVDYSNEGQVQHSSPETFTSQLRRTWVRTGAVATPGARMVVRFGAINDRKVNAAELLKSSLKDTGWSVLTIRNAGTASRGRRQASHFGRDANQPLDEYDVWSNWE